MPLQTNREAISLQVRGGETGSVEEMSKHSEKVAAYLTHLFLLLAILFPTLCSTQNMSSTQNSTSFRVTNFTSSAVLVSGDSAVQPDGSLLMTVNSSGVSGPSLKSRAVYSTPVQFADAVSGTAASFNTSFTFAILSANGTEKGDGMTFIITPEPGVPKSIYSAGGNLALYDVLQYNVSNSSIHVVAVEFDTFSSPPDPVGDHVGVDINSYISAKAEVLPPGLAPLNTSSTRQRLTAWIDYDAVAGQLDVFLAHAPSQKGAATQVLSYGPLAISQYVTPNSYVGFTAATGSFFELHAVFDWNFSSSLVPNPLLSSPPLFPPAPAPAPAPAPGLGLLGGVKSGKSSHTGLIAGVVVGGVGALLLVLLALVVLFRRRRSLERRKLIPGGDAGQDLSSSWMELYAADVNFGPRRFSHAEVSSATNHFEQSALLGQGGFGSVYKGVMAGTVAGTTVDVAVKRVSRTSRQGEREFRAEVLSIGRLRHRNLVPLVGWCHDQGELLLLYELMPNGSLDRWLYRSGTHHHIEGYPESDTSGKAQVLPWGDRYNVLCGVASAIVYLHVEWEKCIVHRDIKASNVMLDAQMNARLGDFGLARLTDHRYGDGDHSATSTAVAGTRGYLAPEYAVSGKSTPESDVFSFGVLALSVATGRRPYEPVGEDEQYLVDWVWSWQECHRLEDVVDARLEGDFNEEQLLRVLKVGLLCTHPDPKARLPSQVLFQMLKGDSELPSLPASRPVAIYVSEFTVPSVDSNLSGLESNVAEKKAGSGDVQYPEPVETSHTESYPSDSSLAYRSDAGSQPDSEKHPGGNAGRGAGSVGSFVQPR